MSNIITMFLIQEIECVEDADRFGIDINILTHCGMVKPYDLDLGP